MIRALALLCAILPAACTPRAPAPVANVHYTLGAPYQTAGVWQYPRESYDLTETGLAVVQSGPHAPLTADGEVYDPKAMAAAQPTLQLPAIARVTDLETGRQVVVRINDRGPADPGRMLAVTPRVAELLGFPPSGVAQVRLEVLPSESHTAADSLPGSPKLALAAAPRTAVQAIPLAAPAGIQQVAAATPGTVAAPQAPEAGPAVPLRLPEAVTAVTPSPGQLWILLSSFHQYKYALMQRQRLAGLPGEVEVTSQGGAQEYRARLGPFATVSEADSALAEAIRAGMADARIAVE